MYMCMHMYRRVRQHAHPMRARALTALGHAVRPQPALQAHCGLVGDFIGAQLHRARGAHKADGDRGRTGRSDQRQQCHHKHGRARRQQESCSSRGLVRCGMRPRAAPAMCMLKLQHYREVYISCAKRQFSAIRLPECALRAERQRRVGLVVHCVFLDAHSFCPSVARFSFNANEIRITALYGEYDISQCQVSYHKNVDDQKKQ